MLHVFIDSNIYLRFFAYADDTLEELEKFEALAATEKIKIYLPEQVQDEVVRNREGEIARAVARFQKSATPPEIPRFAIHTQEAKALLKESKKAAEAKAALSQKITEEIQKGELRADVLIDQLAEHSTVVEITEEQIDRASLRRDIGNPPGKPESLGDQINWECLLDTVPPKTDLHIVSTDEDFFSKLEPSRPSQFLVAEWSRENGGSLEVYKSLSAFTKKHFPEIKLPIDILKSDAVSRLAKSGNFSRTHRQIEKLEEMFDQLTYEDAVILLQAMIDNSQINWIAEDEDVKEFYSKLYKKYWVLIPAEMDQQLAGIADYLNVAPF
jgi:hypothetical protein